jgi:Fe-S cluster biosynthesis and repair protein YggX
MSEATVRTVFCVKLKQELPGLKEVPFDGHPLGQRVYESVSAEAWRQWVEHLKMLMNEYRLNLGNSEAQQFIIDQMEKYFFGEGVELPPDYVAPKA